MVSNIIRRAIIAILPLLNGSDLCEVRHFANDGRMDRAKREGLA